MFSVQWVKNSASKTIALVNGYTFANYTSNTWRCTRTGINCKAKFFICDGVIQRAQLNHNHKSSNYILHNNTYIKI